MYAQTNEPVAATYDEKQQPVVYVQPQPAPLAVVASPVVMMMPVPGFVQQMFVPDAQRRHALHPGRLLYSAQMDHDKLVCLYKAMTFPFCCGLDAMARNTSFDVYTNGIVFTRPSFYAHSADCLCRRPPIGLTRYYDHLAFETASTSGPVCKGGCISFLGYLGCFGDQFNVHLFALKQCCPTGIGHYDLFGCCETVEVTFGFKEGEAARVSGIVNEQIRAFRENPDAFELNTIVGSAGPIPKHMDWK